MYYEKGSFYSFLSAALLSLSAFLMAARRNIFSPKEVKAACTQYSIEECMWYTCLGEDLACSFEIPENPSPVYCEGTLSTAKIDEAIVTPTDPTDPKLVH